MTKLFPVLALLAFAGVSACNTVAGAGADISAGGQAIEKKAEEVRTTTY